MLRQLALLSLFASLGSNLGCVPVEPQPVEKQSAQGSEHQRPPLAPVPHNPQGSVKVLESSDPAFDGHVQPLTETTMKRVLREELSPLFAKVEGLSADVATLNAKLASFESATNEEQRRIRTKLAEQDKKIAELTVALEALRAESPTKSSGKRASEDPVERLSQEVQRLNKALAQHRKALETIRTEGVRSNEQKYAERSPRILSNDRTVTSSGTEWMLVAYRGPCGTEVVGELPLSIAGSARVWRLQTCPCCGREYSARIVSLAPLQTEVLPK
jgi:hypothetical protein